MRGEITPGCDEATPGILVHDDGMPEDGYRDGERWDVSPSIEDVLARARQGRNE